MLQKYEDLTVNMSTQKLKQLAQLEALKSCLFKTSFAKTLVPTEQ
jgi:hypothetical protein